MLQTGVPNLDRILGGGIPDGDVVLVTGPAGAGKTTLALQICFNAASSGRSVVYVSTLSEPPPRLVRHIRRYSFFDEARIGAQIHLVNVYPVVKEGLDRTIDAIVAVVEERRATLLVLDGLDTIRDLHGGSANMRSFVYELAAALCGVDCTAIMTSSSGADGRGATEPELTMSDVLVILGLTSSEGQTVRSIQLQKVRGQSPMLGRHGLRIDRDGTRVLPRIESIVAPSRAGLSKERRSFGLPELDAMVGGGLVRGGSTLVAGAPGTGKTTLALRFILAGAERGEKGLVITFREAPRLLVDKMRSFGLDLDTPVEDERIRLYHRIPVDVPADELVDEIVQQIEGFAPDRVVIDSVAEIEHVLADDRRRRSVLVSLAELLRARDITAIVTREMSQKAGPELELSESPLASLGENLILLRYVEFRGELFRILSILKMRDTAHDRSIRQYEIGRGGVRVLTMAESASDVLTGIARLPSEMRVKRTATGCREDG